MALFGKPDPTVLAPPKRPVGRRRTGGGLLTRILVVVALVVLGGIVLMLAQTSGAGAGKNAILSGEDAVTIELPIPPRSSLDTPRVED